jgi:ribosomal small subunit protein bTHX
MGKGDKKTRRGKLFSGSFGVLRPRKRKASFSVVSSTRKSPVKAAEKNQAKIPEPKKEVKPIVETVPEAKVEETKAEVEETKAEVAAPSEEPVIKEKKAPAKKPAAKKTETKPKKEDAEKGNLKEEAGDKK